MSKGGVFAVVVLVGLALWYTGVLQFPHAPPAQAPTPTTGDTTLCAQVLTPALDPETGSIVEFPTPCDVPEGWFIVENEIPDLNLEVQ